jgi:hypothetical protein
MEVPLHEAVVAPGRVDKMLTPGATMSRSVRPRFENDAIWFD